MKRESWHGKSWQGQDLRSFRLVLTTKDLATLLNKTEDQVRQDLSEGRLTLTGNAIKDLHYLVGKLGYKKYDQHPR